MHASKRLYEQPRAHRLDFINRCTLSDCCGAPIIHGGICFDCREHCEEEDGAPCRTRFGRTSITREDQLAPANVECPFISFREEAFCGGFDGISMSSVSD